MNYGWWFMTLYRRQESRLYARKKKCKRAKWLSEEALQIAVKRRDVKSKGEEDLLNAVFQRIARRDKKAFLRDQCNDRLNKSCYPYPCFPLNKEVALLWAFYLKKDQLYKHLPKKKKNLFKE